MLEIQAGCSIFKMARIELMIVALQMTFIDLIGVELQCVVA